MKGNRIFPEERCVMCGEVIPEGRQVCVACERMVLNGTQEEESPVPGRRSKKSVSGRNRLS